jgi:hypothetical protein
VASEASWVRGNCLARPLTRPRSASPPRGHPLPQGERGSENTACSRLHRFTCQTASPSRYALRRASNAPPPLLFEGPGVSPLPFFRFSPRGPGGVPPRNGGWSAGRAPGVCETPLGRPCDRAGPARLARARARGLVAGCALPALHRQAGARCASLTRAAPLSGADPARSPRTTRDDARCLKQGMAIIRALK